MKKKTVITTEKHEVWVVRHGEIEIEVDPGRCEELLAQLVSWFSEAGGEKQLEATNSANNQDLELMK